MFDNDLEGQLDLPPSYKVDTSGVHDVTRSRLKQFPDTVLFYIFYNRPNERVQLDAATELKGRGWEFAVEHNVWVITENQ
jgi:CCR4-NOT transcriptional regulation complex NOT5 subunit